MTVDSATAYEILELAELAEASLATPDEAPVLHLRARGPEITDAAEVLLVDDPAAALRLVATAAGYWMDEGRVDVGRQLTDRVIDMTSSIDTPNVLAARPRALVAAAELAFRQGDQVEAQRHANDAIAAAGRVDDGPSSAMGYSYLARVAYRDGNAPEIERNSRLALGLAGDDAMANRNALHMLAWAAHTAGDLPEARRRFEKSLAFRRTLGNRLSVAVELSNVGDRAIENGDLAGGARMLAEALAISHEVGSQYMLVNTLPTFAALAADAGMSDDAARLFGAADAVSKTSGLVPDPGMAREEARAKLASALGSRFEDLVNRGRALSADRAVALALQIGDRLSEAPRR